MRNRIAFYLCLFITGTLIAACAARIPQESSTPAGPESSATQPAATAPSSSEETQPLSSTEATKPEPSTAASQPEPSTAAPEPSTAASQSEPSTAAPEPSTEATQPEPSSEPETIPEPPTVPEPSTVPEPATEPETAPPTTEPASSEAPNPNELTETLAGGRRIVYTYDELGRLILVRQYGADDFLEKEECLSYHGDSSQLAKRTAACYRVTSPDDEEASSERTWAENGKNLTVRITYLDGRTCYIDWSEKNGEMTAYILKTPDGRIEYKETHSYNDAGTCVHSYTEELSGRIEDNYWYDDGSIRQTFLRENGVEINRKYNEMGNLTLYLRLVNNIAVDYETYTFDSSGTILTESYTEYRDESGNLLSSRRKTYYPGGTAVKTSRGVESDGSETYSEYDMTSFETFRRTSYPDGTTEETTFFEGFTRCQLYYPNGYLKLLTEEWSDGTTLQTQYRQTGGRIQRKLDKPNGTYDYRYYDELNQMESWYVQNTSSKTIRNYTNGRLTMEREYELDGSPIVTIHWQYYIRDGKPTVLEICIDAAGREKYRAWHEDDGKIGYPPEE